MSGTQVYVTVDGIPNHTHDGVKGSHPAWKAHDDSGLHARVKADKPTNWAELSPEVQALYKRAIKGESLMFMCTAGRKDRRAAGIFLGRRPATVKGLSLTEELAELAAMDAAKV